jgi:hypothetical protein
MTAPGDYPDEMPRTASLDERSIEAILAGDAGAEHAAMTAFVAEMRSVSAGSVPEPSPALSNLFVHGFLTENGDLSATAASNVTGPAPQAAGPPKWRKYTMALKQFVAGLSIVGKLALGAGVAAAATTGAGTAGVLPDPVQHQFARAVDPIAPFGIADPQPGPQLGAPEPRHETSALAASRVEAPPTTTVAPAPTTTEVHATTTVVAKSAEPAHEPEHATPVPPPPTTAAPRREPEHSAPTTTIKEPERPVTTTTRPAETPTPVTFTLACAQNAAAMSVTCSWTITAPTNADRFLLLRIGPDGNRSVGEFHDLSTTSFVDAHVVAGAHYQYMVVARAPGSAANVGRSATVVVDVVAH